MKEIYVYNSYSYLKGFEDIVLLKIKDIFKYKNPKYNSYYFCKGISQYEYLLDSNDTSFPTGLLYFLKYYLDKKEIKYNIKDNRVKPLNYKVFRLYKEPPILRSFQTYCVNLTDKYHRGAFSIPTGLGKSLISIMIIKKLGVNTLIVVPSKHLVQQTYKGCIDFFSKKIVGLVNEGKDIEITNYQSLVKKNKNYFNRFDCLIIDEAHHSSCNSIFQMNKTKWSSIYYRYSLSATLFRNDGTDLKMRSVTGDNIFHYPLPQAIKDKWITRPTFVFYKIKNEKITSINDYISDYKKFIVNNMERNNNIVDIAKNLIKNNRHIVIIVREIKHGSMLKSLIGVDSNFIKGETSKNNLIKNERVLNEFKNKNFPVLIATSVLGEGTDIVQADSIINASGGKAKASVIQAVGRILRFSNSKDFALVVDFIDYKCRSLYSHSLERRKYYEEFKTEIKIMEKNA